MTAHNRLMTLWPTLLTGVMVFLLLSSLIAGERSDLIKANFSKLTTSSRGPFGPIVLQHATRRVPPRRNRIGAGFQFQAAFRNSTATKLLQNSFYAGNIFTTNYFHLYAKYVMQDENLKFFSIDDQQLLQSGVAAVNEAALIAKHMLVEKFYLDRHAGSRYSASFARRGVSGTEYETKYYDKYIRFLGQKMPSESGRLLNFLIQKRWNLMGNMGGVSLRRLRTEIDKIYKKCKWGCSSQAKSKIFAIRGVIHNAMSVEVVEMIDRFLAEHKNERMDKLRADIVRYYTVNISTIVKFARDQKRMIPAELVALLRAESQQLTLEQLERLGTIMELAVDHLRRSFNPEINHLIILLSNYLHTSVEQLYRQNQQMAGRLIPVLIDAIYAQGMLPVGEYKKMRQQLKRASSNKESVAATSTLPRMVYQRLDHLLKPAIVDWSLVYAEAEGVVDDILKSSPISLLDLMITDVKRAETSTQKYIVQTSGITYGYLKFISRDDIISKSDRFIALERRDIPIFEALPLYLAVTAGIITEEYQTELSHVKLKSDARGTPNIYYPKIRDDATLAQLISSEALVKMELTTDGTISIVVASSEEAELFWEQKRPSAIGELPLNLAEKRIRSTQDVGFSNSDSVGAKAANYAELSHLLGGRVVLEGLTIPFFYYHDFLERNPTIKNEIISTLKNRQGKFFSDRIYRNQVLSSWRKKMRDSSSKLNPQLVSKVKEWIIANYSAKSVRFRSSTNAEDLVNFNGAG
ncbi:MAG: hypothetical protein HN730_11100, partial [Bdellovibrionales bacterium]|nr:hypothetical protein [Bdellovibrionales bacterium]